MSVHDQMETEPGLEELVNNVTGEKAAIKLRVEFAVKQISKDAHMKTSLFLYATAGVRRLPSDELKWLLENVWSVLKSSSFLCERECVRTIGGLEEAYFGWIALNYHQGMFGAAEFEKLTSGSLDLGGSSLQVVLQGSVNLANKAACTSQHCIAHCQITWYRNRVQPSSYLQYLLPSFNQGCGSAEYRRHRLLELASSSDQKSDNRYFSPLLICQVYDSH